MTRMILYLCCKVVTRTKIARLERIHSLYSLYLSGYIGQNIFSVVGKVLKNIAVFSFWLAGLVIIAHLMIPHDHHSECSVFNEENECHADNTKLPVKAPVFPLHCHALNDMTFEKASITIVVYKDFTACDLFTCSLFDAVISKSALSVIKIKDSQNPIIETDFLRLSPFRGPPSRV